MNVPANPGAGAGAPAGLLRRIAALAYDLLLLAAVLFMFTLAVFILRGGRSVPPGTIWFQLCLVALVVLFFTWFWVHGGQTLGMRAWRLRVVTRAGDPLGWDRALARFGAGLLAAAPAGVGFLWAGLSPDGLGWHDRLSGTRLLYERPPAEPRPTAAGRSAAPPVSAHSGDGDGRHG